jgi:VWFA-related protein
VELLEDLTASRKALESALDTIDRPELQRGGGNNGGSGSGGGYPRDRGSGRYPGGGGGRFRGGTALYDAVYLAGHDVLAKEKGRKAVILLSDGVDNASKVGLTESIEAAQRADMIVYSILFADEPTGFSGGGGFPPVFGPGGGRRGGGQRRMPQAQRPDGKKILERISKETGGSLFEVSKKHPLEDIYSKIEEELRNQYSLGYTSDRSAASGTDYRKIHVSVAPKGMSVQSRDGYYATP